MQLRATFTKYTQTIMSIKKHKQKKHCQGPGISRTLAVFFYHDKTTCSDESDDEHNMWTISNSPSSRGDRLKNREFQLASSNNLEQLINSTDAGVLALNPDRHDFF
jgi:hypothetical protein